VKSAAPPLALWLQAQISVPDCRKVCRWLEWVGLDLGLVVASLGLTSGHVDNSRTKRSLKGPYPLVGESKLSQESKLSHKNINFVCEPHQKSMLLSDIKF
jgi:hypothetical protein